MINLTTLGWNAYFQQEFKNYAGMGFEVGWITVEHKDRFVLLSKGGEYEAEITGKLMFDAASSADLPKVGDWVVMAVYEDEKKAIIHSVLSRQTKLSRKGAGLFGKQTKSKQFS